jgi:hypothetical protein
MTIAHAMIAMWHAMMEKEDETIETRNTTMAMRHAIIAMNYLTPAPLSLIRPSNTFSLRRREAEKVLWRGVRNES